MRTNRENGMALVTALLIMLLISSIIVGFSWLVMTDQTMSTATSQRQKSYYAAEAGMEQLTAALNNLFAQNYAPTSAEVNAIAGFANQPNILGATFINPDIGTQGSGYAINFQSANGSPVAVNDTITAGPYQGMQGLVTPYTLQVIAQSGSGGEVSLVRTVQTVGIPLFQFGIFSQTDLSFFAGPDFNFGGRVHTNGNLWLAEGSGSTLTISDKITAYGEVIRTNLSNGTATATNYAGTVDVLTAAPSTYRALAFTEGSLVGTLGSAANSNWRNLSIGTYNGYMRDGDIDPPQYTGTNGTGATNLNLEIATPLIGGTPIDMIRRPQANELTNAPGKLGERYFAQASLRILLSDNPADITGLPCETATAPVDLSVMAQPVASWPAAAPYSTIKTNATAYGTTLVPLAASGAQGGTYSTTDGYWLPANAPIIKGFIKIEAQTSYGVPCGTYQDVTEEILGLGYAGRNLNPKGTGSVSTGTTYTTYGAASLPALPTAAVGASTCADPNPNAVIRLERVRDNPSTGKADDCGTINTKNLLSSDFWPNVLFDPREGNPRDYCPDGGTTPCQPSTDAKAQPTLQGLMYYVELDVNNLTRWFTGAIGVTGPATKDPNTSPNDFTVYFSDRRGNYISAPLPSGWPPASPTGNETGEFGFNDTVNSASQYGCPNGVSGATDTDPGETFDTPQDTTVQTYGALAAQAPYPINTGTGLPQPGGTYTVNALFSNMTTFKSLNLTTPANSVVQPNWKCANPAYITTNPAVWPGWYVKNGQEAREAPVLFFRRALKLVNGSTINLGVCPSGVNCGLAIASENPVYVQGNFNAPGGAFVAPYGATSVIADAFTFLSNAWNDVNSFSSTYDEANRSGTTTWYRLAIAAGKGISFPIPTGYTVPDDFGTDGGVHNFLRYIENWGGTLNYRGSIVSLYYNRQLTGIYKCCNTVYSPPTRGYNFDTDFLTPTLLPPRTPMFRDVNTTGFTEYDLPN